MTTAEPPKPDRIAIALRVFVYVFLVVAGSVIFPTVLYWAAPVPFVVATLSTFAAAAVANAITLRIWAHGQLSDIGVQWTSASRWNLLLGFAGNSAPDHVDQRKLSDVEDVPRGNHVGPTEEYDGIAVAVRGRLPDD